MRRPCVICGGKILTGNPRQKTCGSSCAEKFKGIRSERARGKTRLRRDGYVEEHTGRKYLLQHRLVMECLLGRELLRREHVHHINGKRADNRPENLQVIDIVEHIRMHPEWPQVQRRRITRTCENCGKTYERRASRAKETRFCSKSCMSSAVTTERWRRWREERSQ